MSQPPTPQHPSSPGKEWEPSRCESSSNHQMPAHIINEKERLRRCLACESDFHSPCWALGGESHMSSVCLQAKATSLIGGDVCLILVGTSFHRASRARRSRRGLLAACRPLPHSVPCSTCRVFRFTHRANVLTGFASETRLSRSTESALQEPTSM